MGIDTYADAIGGESISLRWCAYDAGRVRSNLLASANPVLLLDKKARARQVLNQLTKLATIAVAGDVVYWYQSSHGTYFDLPNGKRKTGRVMHDRVVWDNEVVPYFRKFAPGVRVIIVSDMCHAESNSRTVRKKGSRIKSIAPPQFVAKPVATNATYKNVLCDVVHLAACETSETARETDGFSGYPQGGVFTTALIAELKRTDNAKEAIEGCYDATDQFGQTPVLEVFSKKENPKLDWR
ncbi:MAG: caspase family protein [Shewanella sp.]